jgi:hypothetical protein
MPHEMINMTDQERERLKNQHWDWLKFIALCALAGITIGAIISMFIVKSDMSGFGGLLTRSPNRIGYTFLLVAGFASTFGIAATGVGIVVRSTMHKNQG